MAKNTGIGYKKGVEKGRSHVDISENEGWIKRSAGDGRTAMGAVKGTTSVKSKQCETGEKGK